MEVFEDYDLIKKHLNKEYSIDDYKFYLNKFKDKKSKLLYFYRIMFDNTNNPYYAIEMEKAMYYETMFLSHSDRKMYQYLNFLSNNENYKKKLCFLGLNNSREENDMLLWTFLCLTNHKNGLLDIDCVYNDDYGFNIDIISRSIEVKNIDDFYYNKFDEHTIFVIISSRYNYIQEYLTDNNIPKKNIFLFNDNMILCRGNQYLDETFIDFKDDEVFIDGGCSDLETTLGFINTVEWKYKKVVAVEPFKEDYNKCIEIINNYNLSEVELVNCGLWSKKTILKFDPIGHGSSTITSEGEQEIDCNSIDNILNGNKATIIKMDIEGSENEALLGSTETIRKYHPTLMICVYHKPNDILKLAKTVFKIRDDYDLYLRHYSYTRNETVLYFVPKK